MPPADVTAPLSITACYAFVPIAQDQLAPLRQELLAFGRERNMQGLVLIATEGINATVAGSAEAVREWKSHLTSKFGEITFKDSVAEKSVFRRWSVKIKPEIVALKDDRVRPQGKHRHLSPAEWQKVLETEDVTIVDTRNTYETAIGKFKGAVDPGIKIFSEFPAAVAQAKIPKDKKVLVYCTGGIRCEKALIAMEEQGYNNVYQLEGGILAYLEQFPHANFEGECFVFDHRVAVDQHLQPSQIYDICPHCGDPGDLQITCFCGTEQKICTRCSAEEKRKTCSKNCANKKEIMSVSV